VLGRTEEGDHRRKLGGGASILSFVSNRVYIAKFHQGFQFIANDTITPVLDVIGPLLALPPFLQAVGGDADEASRTQFVEDRVIREAPCRNTT
jgi:hypothetical protein